MMKITKYPQSCFIIKTKGQSILIDPGSLLMNESFLKEWEKTNYIFITHKHGDHAFKNFLENCTQAIYSTQEVQNAFPQIKMSIVTAGDVIKLDELTVFVKKSHHGYLPRLTHNRAEIEEAVGFIFECENKRIYHTGDTISFKIDPSHECDILLAPVSGHGLVMGSYEVAQFAKEIKANLVIPIHMDNPDFPVNMEDMKKTFETYCINYKILGFQESIEI